MPQIIITQKAHNDIERFKDFMNEVAPHKVEEMVMTIIEKFRLLEKNPKLGQVACYVTNMRKLQIPYGQNGYTAYYFYDEKENIIRIETLRHYREQKPNFLNL